MKKNVILSTVAATVVTGVLMLSGCGSNSTAPEADTSYNESGSTEIILAADGTVNKTVSTATSDGSASKINATTTISKVTKCVDAQGVTTGCQNVCTTVAPCSVKIEAACGDTAKLNYSSDTDYKGAFAKWNGSTDATVLAHKNDSSTFTAFSGAARITQTGGIGACDFDFNTFIVCNLQEVTKEHYFLNSANSEGHVVVLVEYADGTEKWIEVEVEFTDKPDGQTGQPYIELSNLSGAVPVKFSVFSIIKKPATGSTGSTGTTGAAD